MGRAADRTVSLSSFRPVRPSINKSPPGIWGASSCRHCSGGDARETLLIPTLGTSSCIQELQTSNTNRRERKPRGVGHEILYLKLKCGRRENVMVLLEILDGIYDENNNTKRNDQLRRTCMQLSAFLLLLGWSSLHGSVSYSSSSLLR